MKICIDPGHGMANRTPGVFDPGATHVEAGVLYKEADIALKYALTLKDVLRARGIPVFMTRDDDTDVAPVRQRAREAERAGCDLFLSIHLNDFEFDTAHGTETLYRGNANLDLARRIQAALVAALGLTDRGPKERTDLAVLSFNGPAVLVELGFIANDTDRAKLLSPAARAATCEAIAVEVDKMRKVASSQESQMGPEADDGNETDFDITEATYYNTNAPAFKLSAKQDRASFVETFGERGVRSSFDHDEFAALVKSWGLAHFTANELLYLGASHYGAGACGGKNSMPPKTLWANMQKTALLADKIRAEFGHPVSVTSAYRDSDYNACVDGATASQHRIFNALDLKNNGGTTAHMFNIARRLMEGTEFAGGLKQYGANGFIHIDTRGHFVLF
ncbi:MAG: N-acetylmuramoyl-L-alanine amidase [Paracoccaceae bacterium]